MIPGVKGGNRKSSFPFLVRFCFTPRMGKRVATVRESQEKANLLKVREFSFKVRALCIKSGKFFILPQPNSVKSQKSFIYLLASRCDKNFLLLVLGIVVSKKQFLFNQLHNYKSIFFWRYCQRIHPAWSVKSWEFVLS